jgi:hypothetical protein
MFYGEISEFPWGINLLQWNTNDKVILYWNLRLQICDSFGLNFYRLKLSSLLLIYFRLNFNKLFFVLWKGESSEVPLRMIFVKVNGSLMLFYCYLMLDNKRVRVIVVFPRSYIVFAHN